jgi:4-hydroxybenzoate polyprenyltransferase
MTEEKRKNKVVIVLTKYIRLDDVIRWTAISFIGFILATKSFALQDIVLPFCVFLVTTFFCISFIFAINNYYDADSDRENPRRMHKNALASGEISKKGAMFINILCIVITLLIISWYKPVLLYFAILLFVWSAMYSIPPIRIKGRPGIDVIWHFFGFLYIVLWGSLIAGSLSPLIWLMAISLGIFSCIGQLANHYDDFEYDKESGTNTFAVRYGLNTTKKTIEVVLGIHLIIILLLFILYSSHYLITLLFVIGLMILGFLLLKPKKAGFPTKKSYEFYLSTIVGGLVYISILLYHIFTVIHINIIPIY